MISRSDFDIRKAIQLFNDLELEVTFIVPTETGLKKSILDAYNSVRQYLFDTNTHSYEDQKQGTSNKHIIKSYFVFDNEIIETKASLYRPNSKNGDPRIWFYKLTEYCDPYNLIAIYAVNNSLFLFNLSDEKVFNSLRNKTSIFFKEKTLFNKKNDLVRDELIKKLMLINTKGWIETTTQGSTGVGSTIENELGISKNSSQSPDYKGIELKAKRDNNISLTRRSSTRVNLFAKVPNWKLSKCKSSLEIRNRYGYYDNNNIHKLYCTVKSKTPNPQGLYLECDYKNDYLKEEWTKEGLRENVVIWELSKLRSKLLSKHKETFWIGAKSKFLNNTEWFQYYRVINTRAPIVSNFENLIDLGVITLDHLIKTNEKGPLFKINIIDLPLLFPKPKIIELNISA